MNFKRSQFTIQDKSSIDFEDVKGYSTLVDLMKVHEVSNDLANYWNKEGELNLSNPHSLVYED